jgi:hypothetical protein
MAKGNAQVRFEIRTKLREWAREDDKMAAQIRVNATFTPNDEEWDPDHHTGLTEEGQQGWQEKLAALGFENVEFVRQGDR